jgi:hypothetical protein
MTAFEINHYGDTIIGAVAKEDLIEGRLVMLTTPTTTSNDFGSDLDLPGARYANDDTESAQCRYVVVWPVDNRSTPLYEPPAHYDWALRQGFDQATNLPLTPTAVYTTHPSNMQTTPTIPSGYKVLLFGEGIYTVPSGQYAYSTAIETPGCQLCVQNAADNGTGHGRLEARVAHDLDNVVAEVVRYYTADGRLTFKILH